MVLPARLYSRDMGFYNPLVMKVDTRDCKTPYPARRLLVISHCFSLKMCFFPSTKFIIAVSFYSYGILMVVGFLAIDLNRLNRDGVFSLSGHVHVGIFGGRPRRPQAEISIGL